MHVTLLVYTIILNLIHIHKYYKYEVQYIRISDLHISDIELQLKYIERDCHYLIRD